MVRAAYYITPRRIVVELINHYCTMIVLAEFIIQIDQRLAHSSLYSHRIQRADHTIIPYPTH